MKAERSHARSDVERFAIASRVLRFLIAERNRELSLLTRVRSRSSIAAASHSDVLLLRRT